MATVNCTNTKTSPALPGASAWVTLSAAESLSVLPVLVEGQLCESESSEATGTIDRIDSFGHSFRVKPIQPDKQFNSGSGGSLLPDELITITI